MYMLYSIAIDRHIYTDTHVRANNGVYTEWDTYICIHIYIYTYIHKSSVSKYPSTQILRVIQELGASHSKTSLFLWRLVVDQMSNLWHHLMLNLKRNKTRLCLCVLVFLSKPLGFHPLNHAETGVPKSSRMPKELVCGARPKCDKNGGNIEPQSTSRHALTHEKCRSCGFLGWFQFQFFGVSKSGDVLWKQFQPIRTCISRNEIQKQSNTCITPPEKWWKTSLSYWVLVSFQGLYTLNFGKVSKKKTSRSTHKLNPDRPFNKWFRHPEEFEPGRRSCGGTIPLAAENNSYAQAFSLHVPSDESLNYHQI